jgi:adenylate cyclase class IV
MDYRKVPTQNKDDLMSRSSGIKEFETKVLERSPEHLSEELKRIGAKQFSDDILRTLSFRNKKWEKIRVRKKEDEVIVRVEQKIKIPTTKYQGKIKSAIEKWFQASNFENTVETLLARGFWKEWLAMVKRRVSYLIGENIETWVILDFDTYIQLMGKFGTLDNPVIPTLLEIESRRSEEEVIETAHTLWFDLSVLKDWGPKKLFGYYYPNDPIL